MRAVLRARARFLDGCYRSPTVIGEDQFLEVFCDAPLADCEKRDQHGLYERARNGEITNLTGIDAPYEPPASPALTLDTVGTSVEDCIASVLELLRERGVIGRPE